MYKHLTLFKIPNPFHREGDFFSNLLQVTVTDNSFTYKVQDTNNKRLLPRWKLEVRLGRGAGYKWGRTLYLACNLFYNTAASYPTKYDHWWEHITLSGRGKDGRTRWQIGYTNNSNMVPYVDGV